MHLESKLVVLQVDGQRARKSEAQRRAHREVAAEVEQLLVELHPRRRHVKPRASNVVKPETMVWNKSVCVEHDGAARPPPYLTMSLAGGRQK